MEPRSNLHQQPRTPRPTGQAGFSLIEIVVVIVVMGVITSMVSVNWASFMRHQELRQDAINMHKEILTLKARAIENGYGDTLRGGTGSIGSLNLLPNQYVIKWLVPDTADTNIRRLTTKTFTLNSGVVIDTGTASDIMTTPGELPQIPSNGWLDNNSTVKIVVEPDNIDAYKGVYANGRIVLWRPKVNARYCIQKDDSNIKPELYHQSKKGGAWKRL